MYMSVLCISIMFVKFWGHVSYPKPNGLWGLMKWCHVCMYVCTYVCSFNCMFVHMYVASTNDVFMANGYVTIHRLTSNISDHPTLCFQIFHRHLTSLSHTALATFQCSCSDVKATIHVISVTVCTTVFPLLLQTFKMQLFQYKSLCRNRTVLTKEFWNVELRNMIKISS